MDATDGIAPHMESTMLCYDDTVAYEEQLPTEAEQAAAARTASLANRIGNNRVYLLSESSAATTRTTKRKHENGGENAEEMGDDDDDDGDDTTYRSNAILFNGDPISHLPTARLFAYATHFDAHPIGLEWVDDPTCVFVFSSKKDARDAFAKLTKPVGMSANPVAESNLDDVVPMAVDDPVDPDYTTARTFPIALWPPEKRINQSLGQGDGLKGPIRMRWARVDDVKKKGAKRMSQFYKKHGLQAGKELFNGRDLPPAQPSKRKRQDPVMDEERRRKELDRELDDFLAEDEATPDLEDGVSRRRKRTRFRSRSRSPSCTPSSSGRPPSPPSKMRSDYIANDGRTLIERTSLLRFHPTGSDRLDEDGDDRLILPLPRRRRGGRGRRNGELVNDTDALSLENRIRSSREEGTRLGGWDGSSAKRRGPRREGRRKGGERPLKTQQELDDELDAFLNRKD